MAVCEKCWSDAYLRSLSNGKDQVENYYDLLEERKDNPCPQEGAILSKLEEEKKYATPQPVPKCTTCGKSNKDCCCNKKVVAPSEEVKQNEAIRFAKWLKHIDNGTEHYNPITKETTQSIGFSPNDCFHDDIMTVEELYEKFKVLE